MTSNEYKSKVCCISNIINIEIKLTNTVDQSLFRVLKLEMCEENRKICTYNYVNFIEIFFNHVYIMN